MRPPASHPTCEEERELRAIALEALNDAVRKGQAHSVFHRFHIQARRVTSSSPEDVTTESSRAHAFVELMIKQCGEVICHQFGPAFNA